MAEQSDKQLSLITVLHQRTLYSGFLSGFWLRGVEMRCNVLLGGSKLYYIPESKAYDKLGEPGIMLHCAKHNQHA